MPRRSLKQSSFFDPEFVCPSCLEEGTVPWLLARFRSKLFPEWLFEGWRGEGRRGRKAWPPEVLMTLILLRFGGEEISRRGSCRRARTDAKWRAAMGLNFDVAPPDEKTVRNFEKFLRGRHAEAGARRIVLFHEHVVRLCKCAEWEQPEIREMYRQRSQGERLINESVRRGARAAMAWGMGSAELQAYAIASNNNLSLLAEALARDETPDIFASAA